MARICCLAAIGSTYIALLSAALKGAGEPALTIIARLDVAELGKLSPDVLIADVDHLEVDSLEMLRQLRFVLPRCVIVVYTGLMKSTWGRECHLAGASCVLSKESDESQLVSGLRHAIQGGCYTDPRLNREAI
jgi:DNA-binding NarL/FixJ family response regulator